MKVGVCEFHQMFLILCISPISKFFVYNTSILYHGHANVNDGIFVFNVLTAFDGFCMSFGSLYISKSKFKTMDSVYKCNPTKFNLLQQNSLML
jgi:ABC-type multidrug transport system permease subunit